jgi:hypothetical protein
MKNMVLLIVLVNFLLLYQIPKINQLKKEDLFIYLIRVCLEALVHDSLAPLFWTCCDTGHHGFSTW